MAIALIALQQTVFAYYGIEYWFSNASVDEPWYWDAETDFWAIEASLGLWSIFNLLSVLLCASGQGKHLREISGAQDTAAIEVRVARHREQLKESRARNV